MNSLEMKFEEATNAQMDLYAVHGRSSAKYAGKFLDGITENAMMTGPGLYEYFDTSNVIDYEVEGGDLDQFLEPFPTIWNDRVPIEQRAIDIYTGTPGLKLWQKWAKRADAAGILQTPELNYGLNEQALFPGRNGVILNAKQYRAVFIDPFGLVRVHHLPFLDSEKIESRKYKGYPITGYEFFVFNTGLGDVRDENIYMTRNSEVEQFGYSCGTWGPLGPMLKDGMKARFHTGNGRENAYYLIREAQMGLVIKDPGALMMFRPSFF